MSSWQQTAAVCLRAYSIFMNSTSAYFAGAGHGNSDFKRRSNSKMPLYEDFILGDCAGNIYSIFTMTIEHSRRDAFYELRKTEGTELNAADTSLDDEFSEYLFFFQKLPAKIDQATCIDKRTNNVHHTNEQRHYIINTTPASLRLHYASLLCECWIHISSSLNAESSARQKAHKSISTYAASGFFTFSSYFFFFFIPARRWKIVVGLKIFPSFVKRA